MQILFFSFASSEKDIMNKTKLNNQQDIIIRKAKLHNLKNISLKIPKEKLVVISGVSGSGKSSLAFNTLFAEGQRRYIESLSSYSRQFLGKLKKPDVEDINGLSPTIAIEQKTNIKNPRSTIGTSTEIYNYLKLLFSRVGKTFSPISGKEVHKYSTNEISDFIFRKKNLSVIFILTEIKTRNNTKETLLRLKQHGFS